MESRIKALAGRSHELLAQNLRVQKRLFELETLVDVRALTMMRARTRRSDEQAFDPLEMDQYSELHSTAHALAEEAADARVMALRLEDGIAELESVQARHERLAKDLQHLVIGTRMTAAGVLESRLQRNVRTTCQATGKQATLVLTGGDTQIDSDVLNRLTEPLLHLLRNAVDHGLELPHERAAAGKDEAGRIELAFTRQGQQVVMRCSDDGRGLDLAAIRDRAVARGLVAADAALDDDETARLVLLPGFTTCDAVNEVSGRGIGLDVVREWAATMGGTVRFETREGVGCTVELRFAASLSTIQSLIVEAGGHRFALASLHIEQALPRGARRLRGRGRAAGLSLRQAGAAGVAAGRGRRPAGGGANRRRSATPSSPASTTSCTRSPWSASSIRASCWSRARAATRAMCAAWSACPSSATAAWR